MVIAVGDGARVAAVLPELGELLARPLVTLERLQRQQARRRAARRPPRHAEGAWHKLMV